MTNDIKELQNEYSKSLIKKKNVVGTGIGEKISDGKPTGTDALVVFVKKKYDDNTIGKFSADIIPQKINGIHVDVIEVGEIVKHGFTSRVRPVHPGYSCGHSKVTCGTIGGFFVDRDGDHVLLTNNHVAANENDAQEGDPIFQPGIMDAGGIEKNWKGWQEPVDKLPYMATLKKFMHLNKSGNTHDSAIATIPDELINRGLIDPKYPHLNAELAGFSTATVKQSVQKCGRTTGYTAGRVIALHGEFTVGYDFGGAAFNNCVVTSSMSKGGDSGSIIMDMDMRAIGLLFAGSAKVTLANPINVVKDYYGLQTWSESRIPTISVAGQKWRSYVSNDSKINATGDVVNITAKGNQCCFIENDYNALQSISCTINKGSDSGSSWGPGISIQYSSGSIKVNLREEHFGVYYNNNEIIDRGKIEANKSYGLRIRSEGNTIVVEGNDGGWIKLLELPKSLFPGQPISVRIGKTDPNGGRSDYQDLGNSGSCSITNIVRSTDGI